MKCPSCSAYERDRECGWRRSLAARRSSPAWLEEFSPWLLRATPHASSSPPGVPCRQSPSPRESILSPASLRRTRMWAFAEAHLQAPLSATRHRSRALEACSPREGRATPRDPPTLGLAVAPSVRTTFRLDLRK